MMLPIKIDSGTFGFPGFEAITLTNSSEYVISFAGTYDLSAADLVADVNLGAGVISDQLIQAAENRQNVPESISF